jgi:hypothetical protein
MTTKIIVQLLLSKERSPRFPMMTMMMAMNPAIVIPPRDIAPVEYILE